MPLVIQLPFGISADLTFWVTILSWPNWEIIRTFFAMGGWVALALIFFFMGKELWKEYRSSITGKANWKWMVLVVDIPEELVQSPKAVEQIFSHLSGAFDEPDLLEKYWKGEVQRYFSLEIISIEGHIQFLIRTELAHRDLVEAAIYAQYPAAEITEVDDYINIVQDKFPNDNQDVFGLEFGLAREDAFPIKNYHEFEHNISADSVFNDPMAAILENFSRVGMGENLFLQIIIKPTDSSWKEKGIELCKKIIAQEVDKKPEGFSLGKIFSKVTNTIFDEALNVIRGDFSPKESTEVVEQPKKLIDLTPGAKTVLEAVETKISRVGFQTKIRLLYCADKRVFNKSRSIAGFVGSLKQFSNISSNSLEPKYNTAAKWPFKESKTEKKKRVFVKAFKKRQLKFGANEYMLNTEELATIWHFPLSFVKTPLIQKISSRRAEPPTDLVLEGLDSLPVMADNAVVLPKAKDEFATDSSGQMISDLDKDEKIKTDHDEFKSDMNFG